MSNSGTQSQQSAGGFGSQATASVPAIPGADTRAIKISVVIPVYNAARFLPRCLQSVFAQTLQPAEVIVVDDGSTDDSVEVAARLGARVITRPNSGPSAARNAGIAAATSEWIALLDADDLWAPEKLARQADRISDDTVLVYTGIKIFDDSGVRETCIASPPSVITAKLRTCNPIAPSTVLIRRDAILQVGGFREDIRTCEDWDLWFRLLRVGRFEGIADPLTDYYTYNGSNSSDPRKMLVALERIIPTTLVADLRGPGRYTWTQRIRASQLYSAALIARENHLRDELAYMLRSIAAWPSPFWEPQRFASLVVTLQKRLLRPRRPA